MENRGQKVPSLTDENLHEPGVAFTSTRAAREWLILNMAGLEREEFRVLYLNNQNQLIAGETLFTGTINRTEVHPREVIKRALYHNAAAVVLAHNHPSGEVTPSKADRLITERLVQALGLVDIRVPDHLIVGGSQVFSFAAQSQFDAVGRLKAQTDAAGRTTEYSPDVVTGLITRITTPDGRASAFYYNHHSQLTSATGVLQWLLFLSAVPPVQLLTGWCVTAKAPPDISAISALRGLTLSGTKTHVKGFWS